jgi:ATP-dependent exoDNAse (exonuclease V) beta subunit
MTNFDVWQSYIVEDHIFDLQKQDREALVFRPDEKLVKRIMGAFLHSYPFKEWEKLLVKSSASKLLTLRETELDAVAETRKTETLEGLDVLDVGFGRLSHIEEAEGDNALECAQRNAVGTAYHAFLQYFDFSLLYGVDGETVSKSALQEIVASVFADFAVKNAEQAALLREEKLVAILSNPVFYSLKGTRLCKEQEFLVKLPAKETYALAGKGLPDLPQDEADGIIYQGAIDLLALGDEVRVIDYKYSLRDAEGLKEYYAPQLMLYRMAVAKILKIEEKKIRCTIVNIDKGFEVEIE